jgi:hypothetical protein
MIFIFQPSKFGAASGPAILQFANFGCTVMARKTNLYFARTFYHAMCRSNQGAVDLQRASERITPRSSGVEQRVRKAGRGVGEWNRYTNT